MFKKKDFMLAGIILVIAFVSILAITLTKEEGGKVIVTVDGEVVQTLPLDEDIKITIGEDTAEYNILEIVDGFVSMSDANCPDKLCVNHKSIHYNHESIVCLPHKVVIEIQDGTDDEIDIIAQ